MNKKSITKIIFLAIMLLDACAPSPQVIQTAIAQTQAALPTATIKPTPTPRPDITSVLLANGFVLSPFQSYTDAKQYQISNDINAIVITSTVHNNGMFSITLWDIGEVQKAKVDDVLLAAYGATISNWIAPIIEGKDFSQPFEQNGTINGYNIDISNGGQKLNITIMPISE